MHLDRRSFLASALASSLLTPSLASAAAAPGDRRFLFVFASGGWDPTRVFADAFDNPAVDMEPGAERATVGGIRFVDHPARPSVRAFFEGHADRAVVFNGLLVRSIAHEICRMIAMTGDSSGLKPDWPAILGAAGAPTTVPSLVLGGPSFPGPLGASVARTGVAGQLEALVDGDIVAWSDQVQPGLPLPTQHVVERFARSRARGQAARVTGGTAAPLYQAYEQAASSAAALRDLRYTMDFTGGATLAEQAEVAVDALSVGMSRCVCLSADGAWDTHAANDTVQSALFEATFAGLNQLMALLGGTPGSASPSLLDETVVVVLSEMGRTPQLNGFGGKDHWPYTSALVLGPGLTGGRVVGGYDALHAGQPVDPGSAEVVADGPLLSAEALGATLLALADVDPAEHVPGVRPLQGVLA
ncbi:MAG: DUF1501 domain-containing protein [Myxococcota bacterium]